MVVKGIFFEKFRSSSALFAQDDYWTAKEYVAKTSLNLGFIIGILQVMQGGCELIE